METKERTPFHALPSGLADESLVELQIFAPQRPGLDQRLGEAIDGNLVVNCIAIAVRRVDDDEVAVRRRETRSGC